MFWVDEQTISRKLDACVQVVEDRGKVIKMGLKERGYEATGSIHLAQGRFSGDLHIFELTEGRELLGYLS
jgi:hypothetical protein